MHHNTCLMWRWVTHGECWKRCYQRNCNNTDCNRQTNGRRKQVLFQTSVLTKRNVSHAPEYFRYVNNFVLLRRKSVYREIKEPRTSVWNSKQGNTGGQTRTTAVSCPRVCLRRYFHLRALLISLLFTNMHDTLYTGMQKCSSSVLHLR